MESYDLLLCQELRQFLMDQFGINTPQIEENNKSKSITRQSWISDVTLNHLSKINDDLTEKRRESLISFSSASSSYYGNTGGILTSYKTDTFNAHDLMTKNNRWSSKFRKWLNRLFWLSNDLENDTDEIFFGTKTPDSCARLRYITDIESRY